eukprot:m.33309 g.33309  ORF g.33309 m.33309 type:complete len:596 (+) comp14225_c0_seq1:347-2134(+)
MAASAMISRCVFLGAALLCRTVATFETMDTWTNHAVFQSTTDGGSGTLIYGFSTSVDDVPKNLSSVPPIPGTIGAVAYDKESKRWSIPVHVSEGGPFTLSLFSADGKKTSSITDTWFGDVFLCSGQSNMEFPVNEIDAKDSVLAAADRPNLRLFSATDDTTFPSNTPPTGKPANHFPRPVSWVISNAGTAASFSAVCYLSAINIMKLHSGGRAIGLIQTAKGGTPIEGWSTAAGLRKCHLGVTLPTPFQGNDVSQNKWSYGTTLFEQMIGPFIGTGVRSFLWYQGEANMNEGFHLTRMTYGCLLREMIRGWRQEWGNSAIPFNLVQLHSCDLGNTGQCYADWCNYGDIRMAHSDAANELDGVGFAVSFDQGHSGIHSPHKSEVGRRLALKILEVAYDGAVAAADANGPSLVSACSTTQTRHPGASVETINGNSATQVLLTLDNTAGLAFRNTMECETQTPVCCNATGGGPPGVAVGIAQIQLCDVWSGGTWYNATMQIGPDNGTILLTAFVTNAAPRATVCQVRMTLGAFPSCAVVNGRGIPLAPFGPVAVSPACTMPGHTPPQTSPLSIPRTPPPAYTPPEALLLNNYQPPPPA